MKKKYKTSLLGFVLGLVVLAAVVFLAGIAQAGSLEPSAPPGPTTQIPPAWSQTLPGAERFELVMAGAAVLDKETGLVWEQSPLTTTHTWSSARTQCTVRTVGGRKGWRLPSVHELASLVDPNNPGGNPDLPPGHPFDPAAIQSDFYWSATTDADNSAFAWGVFFTDGHVDTHVKADTGFVWCVRGGGPLSEH